MISKILVEDYEKSGNIKNLLDHFESFESL